ncbi:DUF92 domain-containing protein [Chitinophaga qingshengii]|uniref:DUF92 domain-containing protein n=1 Tax=Chitinophaga qingshengii TaxID=1569794 RepID=A0ABR7TXP2_9BACT|nr:DUF92 domain-containing protein [Chitinophaga qingshengii]MBC9934495.1 DUF92 domain-containing protein [Chitinophaga qingshengii]
MQTTFQHYGLFTLLLLVFMAICIRTGKLSVSAALAAGLVGLLVFTGAGYPGIAQLGTFFLLGTLATSHQKQLKAAITAEGAHPEKRKASQVFANGGAAALMALLMLTDTARRELYGLMLAGSLASATADTLSSELGTVYGRRFFNILTFRKEAKGLDGVISLEGTLLGAAGAVVIAIVYALAAGFDRRIAFIVIAGVLGNLMDSILGAALERKHYIGNDAVNFGNTLFAALVAGACGWWW